MASSAAWSRFQAKLDALGVKFEDVQNCGEDARATLLKQIGLNPIDNALVDSLWAQGGPRLAAADKLKADCTCLMDPQHPPLSLPSGNPFCARMHPSTSLFAARSHQLVWTATGECTARHVRDLIAAAAKLSHSVHINTGTHGSPCGLTVADDGSLGDAGFLLQDIKSAEREANVSVHIMSSMAPAIFPPGANHIVLAWCHSDKFDFSTLRPASPASPSSSSSYPSSPSPLLGNESKAKKTESQKEFSMTVGKFDEEEKMRLNAADKKKMEAQEAAEETVIYYDDGGVYKGSTKNGKRHGVGKLEFANGDIYMGQFAYSLAHGRGVMLSVTEGTKYDGEWREFKKHGRGVLSSLETGKKIHEGMWDDDEFC